MKPKVQYGGAWKVAYADLITAVMALFLVLWITAQDTRIKEAVERAFRNPHSAVNKESTGIIPNKDIAQAVAQGQFQAVNAIEMEMLRRITEDLARILQSDEDEDAQSAVRMELTSEGLRIDVFDRAHKPVFETDTDLFTSYGEWVFSTLAWEISRYRTFRIELEGHTDTAARGREADAKWELSTERANAARRILVQTGVTPGQIYKVSGFADTQPLANLPVESELNRRVTVLLKVDNPLQQTASPTSSHGQHS